MATEIEQQIGDEKNKETDTCERCIHFELCFVRKNIFDFMEQHFQKDKSFEVSELAKICEYYYPELKLVYEK